MAKQKKKLTDSEILAVVNAGVREGVRFADTKLAKMRRKTQMYYDGKLPAPVHGGNSSYVSTDVFDTVEAMKATLTETFSASSDIVQFSPQGPEDIEAAKVATAYAKYVVFQQNNGADLFEKVMHDGLMSYVGIVKAYWDTTQEEIEEEFADLDDEALNVLLSDEEVELTDLEMDEMTGLQSGTLIRRIDKSRTVLELCAPEEIILNPNIKVLSDSPFITHRKEKTKSDLLKEGYPKSKVDLLVGSDDTLEMDEERITRFDNIETGSGRSEDITQDARNIHVIYETFGEIDCYGDGVTRLYRIVHCGSIILEMEQIERLPFFTFCPLATPHSFFGTNFAARVIPTQNAKTVLTRSVLDHAVLANNPRYGVVKGALTNPRELLDNRIGGLVNMTRADGVFPLPQAPLNPFVFQTIGMLDDNKEDVTGVSRLSQGLNKEAISSQNSQGMVEQLIGASMQRQKTIARAFATQFLAPLFLEVYRLTIENEKSQKVLEIAGSFVPVTPSSWRRQRDVTIDFRLGYGERDRMAQEYIVLGQTLAADPAIGHLFGPDKRYNVYKAAMEAKGHKDVSLFLADPATVEPPAPDPMMELEMKERTSAIEIAERKQTMAEQKAVKELQLDEMKADFDKRFRALEYTLKVQEVDRKAAETENRIEVAQKEMELAEEAQNSAPPENNKATAIISPNG
jgi:hypothetical protein